MNFNNLNDISKLYFEQVSLSEANEKPKRWWDDDGDGKGYEKGEVSSKFKKKKVKEALDPVGKEDDDIDNDGISNTKSDKYLKNRRKVRGKVIAKEGFSNWREDLIEVVGKVERKDDKEAKITEKSVNNKININPKLNLEIGEAIKDLGGTLLEMVEIDEVDFIVESVYNELLGEGYDEDSIEEAIEYALTEAKVTYGHDTDKSIEKKSGIGHLVKAVGRLARQKLSSKVSGAKRAAAGAVSRGARKVAKGALGVAHKMEGGDKTPSVAHTRTRNASTYRGAGAGQKERVSSGSYTAPTKKKVEKSADPWEGTATSPSKKPTPKPHVKTTTVPSKPTSKRQKQAVLRAQRKNPNLSPEDASRIVASVPSENEKAKELRARMSAAASKRGIKEEYVNEKTLTADEIKKKEDIVKSMKDNASDFEKRYPGRGKEVMYATATKMAKRIAENFIDEAKLPKSQKKGKQQRQSKTLKLTDCDDCTHDQRHPDAAKIDVINPKGEKTHSLTPAEFAKNKLPSGHKYGFDQFRKTKIVKDTTKPNKRVVGYLNREDYSVIDERIRRYPEQRGVTARGSMDDNREFTKDMKSRIGVKNLKAVHFVGDIKKGSGPEKKATVAKHIVSKRPDAKEVHFVDDHPGNVKAVTDTLAKSGKTVKGKVGRTKETGPKVKGFIARPATKSKGTVKAGEVVPVRLGGEGREGNRGIRSGTSPSRSPKETQRRKKQQRMGESMDISPKTQSNETENQNLKDQKSKIASQRAKQTSINIKQRELQALRSTPAGTQVAGFGG